MRRALLLCALLAFVVPVMADPVPMAVEGAVDLGTYDMATGQWNGGRFGPTVAWDCTVGTGYFYNSMTAPSVEQDWGDLTAATTVNGFNVGFATNATALDLCVWFYEGTTGYGVAGNPVTGFTIPISGLPGGGYWGITADIDLEGGNEFNLPAGDWGYSYAFHNAVGATGYGPLLTTAGPDPVGAPGIEDVWDKYADSGTCEPVTNLTLLGTYWFGGSPFAQYHMRLYTPEPSSLALLALGGLALLRRR
jgi:hypothetical protein